MRSARKRKREEEAKFGKSQRDVPADGRKTFPQERDCNDFQLPLALLTFQNALPSSSCHWRSFSLAAAPWTASRLRFRAR